MKQVCKNILSFQQAQLSMIKKGGTENQIDYHSWFIKNAEHFHLAQVDQRLSEATSIAVDAQIKECYHNSWKGLMENLTARYFEGYVWSKNIPIPIEHSWLVTMEGRVIDPTLIINGEQLENQLEKFNLKKHFGNIKNRLGDEYMGVYFPTNVINKFVMKKKATGGFLIDYWLKQRSEP